MAFINQRWFDRPDTLPTARGESSKAAIVAPNGEVLLYATNGGIVSPARTELAPGTRLVRFGSSGLPSIVVQGSWWLDWDNYKLVERFADQRSLPVAVGVRLLCCVPLEWSVMDVVVQVRLKSPLLAYSGASAPALVRDRKTGTTEYIDGFTSHTNPSIVQIYIPGLGSGDVRHDALMFEGYGHLAADASRSGYIVRPMG
jgi:hypothetical protein